MTRQSDFSDLLILGNGYSAHLAAIALDPVLPVRSMIAPPKRNVGAETLDGLVGQHAHSHIFLPRLEQELERIDQSLLPAMADHGCRFVPGSYRLSGDAPAGSRRMFATRWQFDEVVETLFRQRIQTRHVDATVSGAKTEADRITAISLTSGDPIPICPSTLVLDATGTKSPIMTTLADTESGVINQPGNVVYITQFFRGLDTRARPLPDPLIECPHDFGAIAMMLYPGAGGWFSISLAIDAAHKALLREMRDREAFMSFCRQSPHVAAWIEAAEPVGPNKIYINPRNTWNVSVFETGAAPANYLAVGDALTTMLPTLGANCSFAATHIRIIRDLLADRAPHLHHAFSTAVNAEQFAFFQKALVGKQAADGVTPYEASSQNRPIKRFKRRLRRLLGQDRARIIKQLSDSSSL
ncbi:hypothetical protein [Roseovarius sp. M141]|uniref:hypothetical protein n=1 Tax=Roseovarius sp. M141 TaxID=2583806 RepID=UPI0020CE06F8|nr:hypothetical protein [Roseovarius sp. M141]MCQ0091074.1 hypothetical protein [Roseovarius sp. M141]